MEISAIFFSSSLVRFDNRVSWNKIMVRRIFGNRDNKKFINWTSPIHALTHSTCAPN